MSKLRKNWLDANSHGKSTTIMMMLIIIINSTKHKQSQSENKQFFVPSPPVKLVPSSQFQCKSQ